jgi:hypothetical protein
MTKTTLSPARSLRTVVSLVGLVCAYMSNAAFGEVRVASVNYGVSPLILAVNWRFEIDLDLDGRRDLDFYRANRGVVEGVYAYANGGTAVGQVGVVGQPPFSQMGNGAQIATLSAGTLISQTNTNIGQNLDSTSDDLHYFGFAFGGQLGPDDVHYGWISTRQYTIVDIAYESTANLPIVAGSISSLPDASSCLAPYALYLCFGQRQRTRRLRL